MEFDVAAIYLRNGLLGLGGGIASDLVQLKRNSPEVHHSARLYILFAAVSE
jgi:hypothetical protein